MATGANLSILDNAPANVIWVSTSGRDTNSGAKDTPFKTIQAALNFATTKGDIAIMVEKGEYRENIKIPRSAVMTEDKPVWLISAEGQGEAKIIGVDAKKAVVNGLGVSNFGLFNFEVVANSSTNKAIDGDVGGIKFTQSGSDYSKPNTNIILAGNIISGHGLDGIKLAQTDNAIVINNIVKGTFGEESFDNVTIKNSTFAGNVVEGVAKNSGMTFKMGSENLVIADNHISVDSAKGNGILIGGQGTPDLKYFPKELLGFEARDVLVTGNTIDGNVYNAINLMGSNHVTVTGNLAANIAGYFGIVTSQGSTAGGMTALAHDNTIVDNISTKSQAYKSSVGQDAGNIVDSNISKGTIEMFLKTYMPKTSFTVEDLYKSLLHPEIIGTDKNDNITGTAGDDIIHTLSGFDIVRAGAGKDVVHGGSGKDMLYGDAGDDILYGGAGDDHIAGGNDKDLLFGGDGSDSLDGQSGNDNVFGGLGNDLITFGHGSDLLYGEGGADTFKMLTSYKTKNVIGDFDVTEDKLVLTQLINFKGDVDDVISKFISMKDTSEGVLLSIDRDGAGGTEKAFAAILFKDNHTIDLHALLENNAISVA